MAAAWLSMRGKMTWAGEAIPYPRSQGILGRGWPVASLHALPAFSRTPSRSAPVMASLSGRSEAGPLPVKAERTQPNPQLTSKQSLMSGYLVLVAEHLLAEGAAGPCLYRPKYRADKCCSLNKLNCYFHMAFCVSVFFIGPGE